MGSKNYSSDSPIIEQTHDRFSRWSFSKRIGEIIAKRNDPSSIVIGLHGKWGEGKTSVLNFVEKSIEDNKDIICLKFNPWRYGSEIELLTGFFYNIADALDTKLLKKEDHLKSFFKKVAPGVGALSGAKEIGSVISSYISEPDVKELKARVEKELETAKKRVLVLIDDVDRLEKSEIHALFRLVKLTADFKYTSYILAFDKEIVSASLQDRYSSSCGNSGEAFLEKIIQVPLNLPSVESHILKQFCYEGVNEALDISSIKLSEVEVQEFLRDFSIAFEDSLTSPRKAKLYSNTLIFSLPILKDEVNAVDFMLLEGIRIFSPPLYEVLKKNKPLFVGAFGDGRYSSNDKEKELIKNIVSESLESCNSINKVGIIKLLKRMFPKVEAAYGNIIYDSNWYDIWYKSKRICSDGYYSRYFSYSIPDGDVSDKVIDEILENCKKWNGSYSLKENPLNEKINDKTIDTLIRKLRNLSEDLDVDVSYSLAIALSQKGHLLSNPQIIDEWTGPFSQAAILISDLLQNCVKSERIDFAKKCIDETDSLEFKIEIFRWLKREDVNRPELDALSKNEIDEIGCHVGKAIEIILEKDLNVLEKLSDSLPIIFQIIRKYNGKKSVNDYIYKIVLSQPKFILLILSSFVSTEWELGSNISRKSDFTRNEYDNLSNELDVAILFNFIHEYFSEKINDIGEFPRDSKDEFIHIKQFIWVHNQILNNSDKSDDSEEVCKGES